MKIENMTFNSDDELYTKIRIKKVDKTADNNVLAFANCKFLMAFNLKFLLRADFNNLYFYNNCIFSKDVDLHYSTKEKEVIFSDIEFDKCIFEENINVSGCNFGKGFDLKSCIIKGECHLSENIFNYVRLWGSTFMKNLYLSYSVIKNIILFGTSPEEKVTFCSHVFFNNSELNDARFWDLEFGGDVSFVNTKVNSPVYFNRSIFKGKLIIGEIGTMGTLELNRTFHLEYSKIKKIQIFDAIIEHYISLNEATIENIEFNNVVFIGQSLLLSGTKIGNVKDEQTARILKGEATKCNNEHLALEMKAQELNWYYKNLKLFSGNFFEKTPLWLRKKSNFYGTKWNWAVIFIIVCWALSYIPFALLSGNKAWIIPNNISFWKEAINFIWPIFGTDDIKNISSSLQILFYVLGKIFIGYGIYQLIAAFRKNGK